MRQHDIEKHLAETLQLGLADAMNIRLSLQTGRAFGCQFQQRAI